MLSFEKGRLHGLSKIAISALGLLLSVPCYGATLTGRVINKTTNKPDAGEEVVLIALTRSMQEVARTRIDAKGRYSFVLPQDGMHLVRVDHQKASYFALVAPGSSDADVNVYDVAQKIDGVTTEAETIRLETDHQGLHVMESYFVKNASSPPRTQFGSEAYEIYLPEDVPLETSIAMAPGGLPVSAVPTPMGDKGHYSFVFPVRPGETRFQVSYHLPYSGTYLFQPRISLFTANLAIVLPMGMNLAAQPGISFESMKGSADLQTWIAKNIRPSQSLAFTVSGSGVFPDGSRHPILHASPSSANIDKPIPAAHPLDKYKWRFVSATGLILIGISLYLLCSGYIQTSDAPVFLKSAVVDRGALLSVLKEELFALESEHLEEKLSEDDYREQKVALEIILKRALARYPQNSYKAEALTEQVSAMATSSL